MPKIGKVGLSKDLASTPIDSGFLFTTDTKQLYVDYKDDSGKKREQLTAEKKNVVKAVTVTNGSLKVETLDGQSNSYNIGGEYSTGNETTAGIVKLYTTTGENIDGSMTQNAITNALNNKANTSHTHTKSQITDFPSTLKNPTSIKIQLNGGTTEGTNQYTYDGSNAKTINITPGSINASVVGHNHNIDEISGLQNSLNNKLGKTEAAASADKLTVARSITLTGGVTGSADFDGSDDISINTTLGKHTHAIEDIENLQTTLDAKAAKTHTHTVANITGLQDDLDAKIDVSSANYVKTLSISGKNITVTKGDGSTSTLVTQDTNTTYSTFKAATSSAAGGAGLVPAPAAGTQSSKYLRADATWQTPPNTTYNNFKAATTEAAGGAGLVPAPAAGNANRYLRSDATWQVPPNTTYGTGNATTAGLTKLYTSTGSSTDGTMTRAAITTALGGKANASHDHEIADITNLQTTLNGKLNSNANAVSATKLATARTFSITGGATASGVSFDGTKNVALNVTSLDASKLTGTISIDRLPAGALERLVKVEDQDARFALTTSNVQLGDSVQQLDTGTMYIVVDTANLDNANGYVAYTAGSAASVPWSGVTGKPSTFTPSSHTHTKSQITDFPSTLKNPTSIKIQLNGGTTENTNQYTYDGSNAKTINITASKIGAAASSHSHSIGNITNLQSSLDAKLAASSANYVKALSISGRNITVTKGDGSTSTLVTQDTNTTYSTFKAATSSAAGGSGLVPAPTAGSQSKFLRADATWQTPTNTTYSNFKAATTEAAGGAGLVPAPAAGDANRYLRSDATWQVPPDTKYSTGTTSTSGLTKLYTSTGSSTDGTMTRAAITNAINGKLSTSSAGYIKSLSISGRTITYTKGDNSTGTLTTQDTNTTYSTFKAATSSAAGGTGLVPAPAAGTQSSKYLRADATWQTPPNTTYGTFKAATSSAAGGSGLVPAPAAGAQSKYLRADATWQTPPNTTYSTGTTSTLGLTKLYTSTGTSTDGTMTRKAITDALGTKLNSNANAVSASKWATARTITLGGDCSGSVSIDGSANVTLTATVKDDSHSHTIANVDNLQSTLDSITSRLTAVETKASTALTNANSAKTVTDKYKTLLNIIGNNQ